MLNYSARGSISYIQNTSPCGNLVPMAVSFLTSAQVADRLGVSQRQVRNMVRHGQLDSQKAGTLLLISSDSMNRALQRPRRPGRAWSSPVVWAALAILSGQKAPWLEAAGRYRLRVSLKTRSVDDIMAAARSRAKVRTFRATPEVLDEVRAHVSPTGGSAMGNVETAGMFGLAEGYGFVDGYVPAGMADRISHAFHMEESPSGNVTLREVDFEEALRHGVPAAAVALDLAEAVSAREQSAGRSALQNFLDDMAGNG